MQYGSMLVLKCGIGLLTPPVGSVLFIGSGIAKRPMEKVVKEMVPFYVFMIIALILITFIPAITLCIPWAIGYGR
jgi:TRAP-type C4-dicarboxylate transport system permease large subunit